MNAKKLFEAALSLPVDERALLAHTLLDSLDGDGPADPDIEAAWIAEIATRAKELDDGSVVPVDWAEARERIRRNVSGGGG